MRKLPLGLTVAGLTAALMILSACGSSSSSHGTGGNDAGADTGTHDTGAPDSTMPTDSGADTSMMMGMDSGPDVEVDSSPGDSATDAPPPDAGDGSTGVCNFATEVKMLIMNDTTSSAVPVPISTFNGCTDDMNQADYPPSFF